MQNIILQKLVSVKIGLTGIFEHFQSNSVGSKGTANGKTTEHTKHVIENGAIHENL